MSSSLKETDGTTTDGDWYELASWPTNTIIYSIWNGVKQVSNNSFTSNNLNLSYNGTTYNSLSDFNNSGVSKYCGGTNGSNFVLRISLLGSGHTAMSNGKAPSVLFTGFDLEAAFDGACVRGAGNQTYGVGYNADWIGSNTTLYYKLSNGTNSETDNWNASTNDRQWVHHWSQRVCFQSGNSGSDFYYNQPDDNGDIGMMMGPRNGGNPPTLGNNQMHLAGYRRDSNKDGSGYNGYKIEIFLEAVINPPTFNSGSYSGSINENVAAGTVVALEGITNNQLINSITNDGPTASFSITGGTGNDIFTINSSTGAISLVSGQSLDYESTQSYTLNISMDNGEGTASTTVTITITDVNEAPTFNSGSYSGSINENVAAGTVVTLQGITNNQLNNSITNDGPTASFSITGGTGNGIFTINSSTGAISLASGQSLDYETYPSYTLNISVNNTELSGNSMVDISINQVVDGGRGGSTGGGGGTGDELRG